MRRAAEGSRVLPAHSRQRTNGRAWPWCSPSAGGYRGHHMSCSGAASSLPSRREIDGRVLDFLLEVPAQIFDAVVSSDGTATTKASPCRPARAKSGSAGASTMPAATIALRSELNVPMTPITGPPAI